jgi:hypothetical protein
MYNCMNIYIYIETYSPMKYFIFFCKWPGDRKLHFFSRDGTRQNIRLKNFLCPKRIKGILLSICFDGGIDYSMPASKVSWIMLTYDVLCVDKKMLSALFYLRVRAPVLRKIFVSCSPRHAWSFKRWWWTMVDSVIPCEGSWLRVQPTHVL